jgi:phosphoserine phosphatase RsbU/P
LDLLARRNPPIFSRNHTLPKHPCERVEAHRPALLVPTVAVTMRPASLATSTSAPAPIRPPTTRSATPEQALLEALERLQTELNEVKVRESAQARVLEQLEAQLREAAGLQRLFLPAVLPSIPGFEVRVIHQSCEEVGGDSYDAVRLDEHRVGFSLADATGHGIPAAMLSAFVRRGLRELTPGGADAEGFEPNDILRRVNLDLLRLQLPDCQSVAALYGVIDPLARTVRWARGGTPHPILIRRGCRPTEIRSEGALVGVHSHSQFENMQLRLAQGDTLLFFTDGLEEVLRPTGRNRGHGADQALAELVGAAWSGAMRHIEARIEDRKRNGGLEDDLTLLVVHARDDGEALVE